jgi:hypothetical protein
MIINGSTLTADKGKVLQKGDVIAVTVHLGVNDKVDNWTEIDKSDEEISDSEALEIITGGADA